MRQNTARAIITVVCVMFSVVLILIQVGIYFGFMHNASAVIEHCPADLWVMSTETVNTDCARPFDESLFYKVKGTPGIEWASRMTHCWGYLKLTNGAGLWCQVVGFDPANGVGGPWELVKGSYDDLKKPGTYIIDEASVPLLRGLGYGDKLENFEQKIEIVGVCRGVKSYTTYPVMFTSYKTAQDQYFAMGGRLSFIAVKVAPGTSIHEVRDYIGQSKKLQALTGPEFSGMIQSYWATQTGIGVGIGVSILLGIVVGILTVGLTTYAATMERLKEFATMKAIGATNFQVCKVVWAQAISVGIAGYAVGAPFALLVQRAYAQKVISVQLTPELFLGTFVGTIAMCFLASMLSVMKVTRLEPVQVFRNG